MDGARPHLVTGGAVGVAMNLTPVVEVYGAICRELGLDFGFPGGAAAPWEAVDAGVVAGALLWAATSPNAAKETFNVTNGELFDWRDLWPSIAATLGLPAADDTPRTLATFLPEHADAWERSVEKHDLRRLSLAEVLGESHHLIAWVSRSPVEGSSTSKRVPSASSTRCPPMSCPSMAASVAFGEFICGDLLDGTGRAPRGRRIAFARRHRHSPGDRGR